MKENQAEEELAISTYSGKNFTTLNLKWYFNIIEQT